MAGSLARSSRDVVFTVPADQGGGTLNCQISRGKGTDGRAFRIRRIAVAAEEGQQPRLRETARTYADWTRGSGFGRTGSGTDAGYNWGQFLYARSRGMLMPAGELTEISIPSSTVQIDSAFDLAGSVWMTCQNQQMIKVVPGNPPAAIDAAIVMTAGAVTRSAKVFGDRAWIANGAGARIWSFDGTNWTAATEDVRRGLFAVTNWDYGAQFAPTSGQIGFTARTLIGTADGTNAIYHVTADPGTAGNWVGPNSVGDAAYPIKAMTSAGNAVFATTPTGVYVIEGGGHMRNLAPHWVAQYDPDNGRAIAFYDEFLLATTAQYLDFLSPDPDRIGLQQPCHPGASESAENSPTTWRCTATSYDSGHVLAAFWDGTYSYIMAGRRTARLGLNSRNPMTWYGSECTVLGAITMLHVMPAQSDTPRWLLMATRPTLTSGSPRFYAQSLPAEHTPYMSWKIKRYPHRFAPQFICMQSMDDMGDPDSPKNMRYISAVTENASNTRSLNVATTVDDGIGVNQVDITAPGRQFAVFDTATAAGVNVAVRLTGNSEPTEPLVIRSVKLRGTINDERTVVYQVPLTLGRDVNTNRGTRDGSSPFVKRAQLWSLLEAGPITAVDWNNITRTMVLEDIQDEEVLDDDGIGITIYATVTLSVLLTNAVYGQATFGFDRYG